MTQTVGFNLAKLLKENGFDIPTTQFYTSGKKSYLTEAEDYMTEKYAICNWNNGFGSYPTKAEDVACSAPTITEVVMWLHNKHNIWISVYKYKDHAADVNDNIVFRGHYTKFKDFNSPTEAYEAAINYVLTKLI